MNDLKPEPKPVTPTNPSASAELRSKDLLGVLPGSPEWKIGKTGLSYDCLVTILGSITEASTPELLIAFDTVRNVMPPIAAEHAIKYEWKQHPMFGIAIHNEWFKKWADAGDCILAELERRHAKTPNSD